MRPTPMLKTIECPDCEDGKVWKSKYGGNDPDVWAVECKACDGTGVVEIDLNDFCDEEDREEDEWPCNTPSREYDERRS